MDEFTFRILVALFLAAVFITATWFVTRYRCNCDPDDCHCYDHWWV